MLRRISIIVVSADVRVLNQGRFVPAKVFGVELGEGEVSVAVQSHVGAESVLVDQLRNELRCECNDESLKQKLNYIL